VSQRKRFLLRVDPRLYEVLERWAADELRSVNAQIELLLREQARRAGRFPERTDPGRRATPGPRRSEPPQEDS
jgi:hypothetical protein